MQQFCFWGWFDIPQKGYYLIFIISITLVLFRWSKARQHLSVWYKLCFIALIKVDLSEKMLKCALTFVVCLPFRDVFFFVFIEISPVKPSYTRRRVNGSHILCLCYTTWSWIRLYLGMILFFNQASILTKIKVKYLRKGSKVRLFDNKLRAQNILAAQQNVK